jgi:hypothetical protein
MKDKVDQTAQHQRFIETARALGCDEDKERFEAALGKVAAHKPADTPKKKRPRGKR